MFGNKRRLQREFKELRRDISSVVEDASLYQCDSLTTWRVTMKDFDEEMESAKDLAEDLVELKRRFTGFNGKITMELNFTNEYPEEPPLIRIVLPRMIWYTGFVTAGGSICAEFLVRGSQKYNKDYKISQLLRMVRFNMLTAERVLVRTSTGPGGMGGPLRVDLNGRYGNPLQPYSLQAAKQAFSRMADNHRQNGW